MTRTQDDELARIALWLRTRAADLISQVSARKQAADCMRHATAKELKEAANLIRPSDGRTVKAMTVKDANESSARHDKIAGRLMAEAEQLLVWAAFLEDLRTP